MLNVGLSKLSSLPVVANSFVVCIGFAFVHSCYKEWEIHILRSQIVHESCSSHVYGKERRKNVFSAVFFECTLSDQYFKSQQDYLKSDYVIQLIAFHWDTACTRSSPDPSFVVVSGL